MTAAGLIREARLSAGLTQAELAERVGSTQSAVARLERRGSNPTVGTLDRVLRALGWRLRLEAEPLSPGVDEAQIAAHLRLTPEERAALHDGSYRNVRIRLRSR